MNNIFYVLVLIFAIISIYYLLKDNSEGYYSEGYYPDLTLRCRSSYFPYYQYSRNYDRDILGRKRQHFSCKCLP